MIFATWRRQWKSLDAYTAAEEQRAGYVELCDRAQVLAALPAWCWNAERGVWCSTAFHGTTDFVLSTWQEPIIPPARLLPKNPREAIHKAIYRGFLARIDRYYGIRKTPL